VKIQLSKLDSQLHFYPSGLAVSGCVFQFPVTYEHGLDTVSIEEKWPSWQVQARHLK
jgi:hypothetical protein